jgi:hypothetical protein
MNTYSVRSASMSTLGVALALASGSALAATYRLTDLGTLGGTVSIGNAINASGQVTGWASTTWLSADFHKAARTSSPQTRRATVADKSELLFTAMDQNRNPMETMT